MHHMNAYIVLTGDIADSCIAYSKEISMMGTRKASIDASRGTVLDKVDPTSMEWLMKFTKTV